MRAQKAPLLFLLAVMSSCGAEGDGLTDTPVVAPGPQERPELEQPEAPAPAFDASDAVTIAFAAGGRWAVLSVEGEPSFVVVDRDRRETYAVAGQPMGEPASGGGMDLELALAAGAPRLSLVGDDHGRILVRVEDGVRLVDLAERGRTVAGWVGRPSSVSLDPRGEMFAVATDDAMHLVQIADGLTTRYAGALGEGGAAPRWGAGAVSWVAGGTLTRVERSTLAAEIAPVGGPGARFAMSSDADVVAVAVAAPSGERGAPARVTINARGRAILDIASADVSEIVVDEAGSFVAWVERKEDPEPSEDGGHLHTFDVATRAHVRFAMKGSGCAIAPETIDAVRDGRVHTDASCRIGCPSIRWSHREVIYDARTGRVLDDTSTTEERSYNETFEEARERIESVAETLGVEVDAMLHASGNGNGKDVVLVSGPAGLSLVDVDDPGRPRVELEASDAASLADVAFSDDGRVVAGVVGGRPQLWDTTTGRALLR